MQSKLIQELYRRAKPLVKEIFPESSLLKLDNFPADWRVWGLNHGAKLKMFLVLAPSPKDDSFALEIAWTIHDTFPEYDGRHPDEDRGRGKMYFRLSEFWQRYGMEHRWYLGSARGTEEIKLRAIPMPPELEALSKDIGWPHNQEYLDKLKKIGLDVSVPRKETLEVKLESVGPQLDDALAKLRQHGIPYLKQVAERHGAELRLNE